MQIKIDSDALMTDLANLAKIGRGADGGITRRALSAEDRDARDYVIARMRWVGLQVRHDEVGNVRARRADDWGNTNPSVMTGSHLDSVPSGGRLDGPLGVVGAVAALDALGRAKVACKRPLEVVIFVGEEGSRFPRGTIGSAAISGFRSVAEIYALIDPEGVSFASALKTYADRGQPMEARVETGSIYAFVELHVEQGGVLEAARVPIGVVTAIAGLVQRQVTFIGVANHAGATPMAIRKDALTRAAEWVLAIEQAAHKIGSGVVATVGQFEVFPGGKNIIPGRVEAICDLRAPTKELLDAVDKEVMATLAASKRDIAVDERLLQRVEPGPMHERAMTAIERTSSSAGLKSQRMLSGAIHDALHIAEIAPSSMIFVPSIGGKSHCPDEDTAPEHLVQGCEVLARTLADLANS